MNTGIYEIRNVIDGKRYIGSAVDFRARWHKHERSLSDGNHRNVRLQNAWNKHGEAAFTFEKLLICDRANLLMYEQLCFDGLKPEYNLYLTAGSALGYRPSPETVEKRRLKVIGQKRTPEQRARIAAAKRGVKQSAEQRAARSGWKHSADTIARLRVASAGKKMAPEAVAKSVEGRKRNGYKRSAETIAKHAEAIRGRKASEETRAKMSAARIGVKRPPGVIEKMQAARREWQITPEARAKMSESAKRRAARPRDAKGRYRYGTE